MFHCTLIFFNYNMKKIVFPEVFKVMLEIIGNFLFFWRVGVGGRDNLHCEGKRAMMCKILREFP